MRIIVEPASAGLSGPPPQLVGCHHNRQTGPNKPQTPTSCSVTTTIDVDKPPNKLRLLGRILKVMILLLHKSLMKSVGNFARIIWATKILVLHSLCGIDITSSSRTPWKNSFDYLKYSISKYCREIASKTCPVC